MDSTRQGIYGELIMMGNTPEEAWEQIEGMQFAEDDEEVF